MAISKNTLWSAKQRGSSLIYAMFFAMIMAIAVTQLYRRSDFSQNNVDAERFMSVRETLYRRLNTLAAVDDNLFFSAHNPKTLTSLGNQALLACTTGLACPVLGTAKLFPFLLADPTGAILAGSSGLNGQGVGYDKKGKLCDTPQCGVYWAQAYFYATCASGLPICVLPEQIHTIIQITTTGASDPGHHGATSAVPGDLAALLKNPTLFANNNFVQNIVKQKKTCPAGSTLTAVKDGGVFACTCNVGKPLYLDSNGLPVCQSDGTCAAGQVFTGVNGLGQSQCLPAPPNPSACPTKTGTVSMLCNMTTCTQLAALVVACDQPNAMRLSGVGMPTSSANCNKLGDPSKKAPSAPTNVICTISYSYKCCP